AFAAGLGVNLAVSLVLWHGFAHNPLEAWWVRLVQANVIAASAGGPAWLAGHSRLYGHHRRGRDEPPPLGLPGALCPAGDAVLLVRPAALLVLYPDGPAAQLSEAGTVWGWLALAGAMTAAVCYAGRLKSWHKLSVWATSGLAASLLAACTVAHWWPQATGWL